MKCVGSPCRIIYTVCGKQPVSLLKLFDYTQRHRDEVIAHLQRRASGGLSSIGNEVNYANPDQLKNASPATSKWVEEVVKQAEKSGHVYGTGKMKHYHGLASGERPAPKFDVSLPKKYGNEEKK